MPPPTFVPADRFDTRSLSQLFTRAYTDYPVPVQVDAAGFETLVHLYDIDLRASRVGLAGEEPIALALLGVRPPRGWIGGLGVAPDYRGERVGRAAAKAVVESARAKSLRSIDLEVLTDNAPALRVYEALGFQRRRVLDVWTREADATFPMPPELDMRPLDVSDCLAAFDDLHAVAPPWQRDLPVLRRVAASLRAIGVTESGRVSAYVLYRMDGARVVLMDAAAAPGKRTSAIEAGLRTLIRDRAGSPLRLVNLPHDDPASEAMHRIGAAIERQQHEMTLDL